MCPVFKREALGKVLHTFTLNKSGWGLDAAWGHILREKKIAIIDSVGVYHDPWNESPKKPKGWFYKKGPDQKDYYKKLTALDVNPLEDFKKIINQYG